MAHKIQLRGDTLTNWTSENPVLWLNEPAIETNDGKFKLKVGNGIDQYLDLPYLAGEGSLAGTKYVFVQGNGTASANATELQAAYNLVKTMSPSSGNTITVVVAPGTYTFGGTKFPVNTPYINIVSLTGNADVILDGVNVTTNNVYLKGLNCGVNSFTVATNLNGLICENCIGGDDSFAGDGGGDSVTASGTFTNCIGGDFSFGGYGTASGTFTNCTGGHSSFGDYGTASGIFTDCSGGLGSFGGGGGAVSGNFTNCTGGDNSFGGFGGNVSGNFTNCTGGDNSFGGMGIASGSFKDCIGGSNSFGGDYGTVSGIFTDCSGGLGSFGGNGGTIASTARLYYCHLTTGTFETPAAGGKIVACIDGNDDFIMIS